MERLTAVILIILSGDRDITYDANLTCPIVLASKAVIFNWKDSLQKVRNS